MSKWELISVPFIPYLKLLACKTCPSIFVARYYNSTGTFANFTNQMCFLDKKCFSQNCIKFPHYHLHCILQKCSKLYKKFKTRCYPSKHFTNYTSEHSCITRKFGFIIIIKINVALNFVIEHFSIHIFSILYWSQVFKFSFFMWI